MMAMPRIAISALWLTPSVFSTYSRGRLAVTAVIVMSPIRISSRMRSLVRKSSFSFPSAILPPFLDVNSEGLGVELQVKIATDVEGFRQGRLGRARSSAGARAGGAGRQKLHYPAGLRAAQGGAEEPRR